LAINLDGFAVLLILFFLFLLSSRKVQPAPTPTPAVTVSLDVSPSRFNPCEAVTVQGFVMKENAPVVNVPVTVYADALGVTQPVLTVSTDANGEYSASGTVGSDRHFTAHAELPVTVWAQAIVDGVTHESPHYALTVYVDECMGPCAGAFVSMARLLLPPQQ